MWHVREENSWALDFSIAMLRRTKMLGVVTMTEHVQNMLVLMGLHKVNGSVATNNTVLMWLLIHPTVGNVGMHVVMDPAAVKESVLISTMTNLTVEAAPTVVIITSASLVFVDMHTVRLKCLWFIISTVVHSILFFLNKYWLDLYKSKYFYHCYWGVVGENGLVGCSELLFDCCFQCSLFLHLFKKFKVMLKQKTMGLNWVVSPHVKIFYSQQYIL